MGIDGSAAEPRRNGFDLWGYQDDTPEIVYLGSDANEAQLEKLADEFLLGDPEIINPPFFLKDASGTLFRMEVQIESERRSAHSQSGKLIRRQT
jgi:hypothetical protein